MVVTDIPLLLRPVSDDDLDMLRRFCVEPGLIGLDWRGFQDAQGVAKRFADDGFLGERDGRLSSTRRGKRAGFVSFTEGLYAGRGALLGDRHRAAAGLARPRHRLARAGDAV